VAFEKLKRYKSPGTDQTPAEVIQAGSNAMNSEIHKLINYIWNKEDLPGQWKELILYLLIRRMIKQIVAIIKACYCNQLHSEF
jgi:hypothetical protein